jgi:hypothetical protein
MASLTDRMIGAMKADVKTFEEVEKDPNALGQAVTVIVIAAVAALIGRLNLGIGAAIGALLAGLIGYAVWTILVVLIGTKLMPEPATRADFSEAFRVIGFAAAPGVFSILAIIPILGYLISFIVNIWMLVVMVVAVRSVLDYTSTARAIVVCLIGLVVYCILYFFLLVPFLILG